MDEIRTYGQVQAGIGLASTIALAIVIERLTSRRARPVLFGGSAMLSAGR
jgi:hypothetical protein